jgi:hypothetical protein
MSYDVNGIQYRIVMFLVNIEEFGSIIGFSEILQIHDYTLQITNTKRLVFSVTIFSALLDSSFQRRTLRFLWVPELSPASATNF